MTIKLIPYEELEDIEECGSCPYNTRGTGDGTCHEVRHVCDAGYFREVLDETEIIFVTCDEMRRRSRTTLRDSCDACYYHPKSEACYNAPDCDGGLFLEIPRDELESDPEPIGETGDTSEHTELALKTYTEEIQEPNRYKFRGTESLPFCIENNLNTIQNNVLKYVYRYPKKGGKEALEKAVVYLRKGIEFNQVPHVVNPEAVEKFITDNNFTWREGNVLYTCLMGSYQIALDRLEKLIKEVYGEKESC